MSWGAREVVGVTEGYSMFNSGTIFIAQGLDLFDWPQNP